jgi:hypothetical protein
MARTIHVLAILAGLAGIAYKLRDVRRHPGNPTVRTALLVIASYTLALIVAMPPLYERVPWIVDTPSLVRLLEDCVVVFAGLWTQVLLLYLSRPDGRPAQLVRRRIVIAAVVLVAMIVLFHLAPVGDDAEDFVNQYAGRPFVLEYLLVFLAYFAFVLTDVYRQATRMGRYADNGYLRWGLHLLRFAAVAGFVYVAHKAAYAILRWAGATLPWPEGPTSTALIGVMFLPAVLGTTIASWSAGLVAARRALDRYRAYQRLLPLWRVVSGAVPGVVLVEPAGSRVSPEFWRTLEFSLHRRVIEILDARLALRPHTDDRIARLARERAEQAGLAGAQRDAVIDAAVLAAAVRAKAADTVAAQPESATGTDPGADLDAEVDRLVLVARAYRESPVVSSVLAEATAPTG